MNYNKVYDQLVNKVHQFIDGEYSEVHHKIPRSLGGSDDDNNLVRLTAREHYESIVRWFGYRQEECTLGLVLKGAEPSSNVEC